MNKVGYVYFTNTPFLVAVRLRMFLPNIRFTFISLTTTIAYKSIESTVYDIN